MNSFHSLQTKLELSLMDNIKDDIDFCVKLAREENLVFLPGKIMKLSSMSLDLSFDTKMGFVGNVLQGMLWV